jgi:hypothetical protein
VDSNVGRPKNTLVIHLLLSKFPSYAIFLNATIPQNFMDLQFFVSLKYKSCYYKIRPKINQYFMFYDIFPKNIPLTRDFTI